MPIIRMINSRDVMAGLLFLSAGLVTGFWSAAYPLGNAMRMGPGYFPLLLGIVLAVLGIGVLFRGLKLGLNAEQGLAMFHWRPALFVGAGVVAFALLAQHQGLLIAILVLTVLSGLARPKAHWPELLGLGCALAVFGVAVFSFGLGLPLPILPV